MTDWNLSELLNTLHTRIQGELQACRVLAHPTDKGDASEDVWLKLMQDYLPQRYRAEKAHVVDSNGEFSEQIDIVIFDRQYTPLIFELRGSMIVPAESVYAVFEVKQTANKAHIEYAQEKIHSVRRLTRTSAPITHAGGVYAPQKPKHILGGFLALRSEVTEDTLYKHLSGLLPQHPHGKIDIGCVAEVETNEPRDDKKPLPGYFFSVDLTPAPSNKRWWQKEMAKPMASLYAAPKLKHRKTQHSLATEKLKRLASKPVILPSPPLCIQTHEKAATAFLFRLISLLQTLGTVPAIDMDKYAQKLISPPKTD
ncbi:hypothetical protein BXU06_07370 [Aquaspirillum sp. LM1]|uniref:DUF6602 domain-containing protein n=1 Tax=Aquaspirillum sp. LM1 TaxID=1938604 RepID=UPI000983B64D|nr:DUF6602 domain-containing protein [Aquaspirillum sp. LM1]AQR64905.1 hypothetical protein BXU06_07370 [Aquaspirillum sp. LM1]